MDPWTVSFTTHHVHVLFSDYLDVVSQLLVMEAKL